MLGGFLIYFFILSANPATWRCGGEAECASYARDSLITLILNYYVMVFRNVCFELEFVIGNVILVRDNSCRYEFTTYDLCHSVAAS